MSAEIFFTVHIYGHRPVISQTVNYKCSQFSLMTITIYTLVGCDVKPIQKELISRFNDIMFALRSTRNCSCEKKKKSLHKLVDEMALDTKHVTVLTQPAEMVEEHELYADFSKKNSQDTTYRRFFRE
jgi:hypothetical protein